MLKGTKSTSLNYQSMIGDQVAVYMTAQIPESGRSNSSKTIQNIELYEANKVECRKDMEDFDDILWSLEDQNISDNQESTESESETTDNGLGGTL